jgi:hypothetical protein
MSLFLSSPIPSNNATLIPFKEPRSLVGLAVKPAAVFREQQDPGAKGSNVQRKRGKTNLRKRDNV